MGHLGATQSKYKDKGLTVIGLTNEPRGLVDKFVAETKATHPIVIENGDSMPAYESNSFPTIVLIGADGRILATGGIADQQIEEALKAVILPPTLPAKLAPAQALLDKRKFGEARVLLEKASADEKAAEDDKSAAAAAVTWIDELAKRRMDGAAADASKGDPVSAAETYEQLAEQFKGTPAEGAAAAALKELLADPAKKKEVDGAKAWDKLQTAIRELKPKKAIPKVKGFLSSFKGTKAAEAAQKVLDGLVAQDK